MVKGLFYHTGEDVQRSVFLQMTPPPQMISMMVVLWWVETQSCVEERVWDEGTCVHCWLIRDLLSLPHCLCGCWYSQGCCLPAGRQVGSCLGAQAGEAPKCWQRPLIGQSSIRDEQNIPKFSYVFKKKVRTEIQARQCKSSEIHHITRFTWHQTLMKWHSRNILSILLWRWHKRRENCLFGIVASPRVSFQMVLSWGTCFSCCLPSAIVVECNTVQQKLKENFSLCSVCSLFSNNQWH